MSIKIGKIYRYIGSVLDMFTNTIDSGTIDSQYVNSISKGECCIVLKQHLNEIFILKPRGEFGWVFHFANEWTEVCP